MAVSSLMVDRQTGSEPGRAATELRGHRQRTSGHVPRATGPQLSRLNRGAVAGDASLDGRLARCVAERARSRTLQRLIAVNPAGTPHTDYAIVKQIHQLRASQPAKHRVVMLSGHTDFSHMGVGEDLFIVSHGDSQTGHLRDLDPQTLIGWLNNGQRGLPPHFGKIVVLSCYGGMPKSQGTSLAQKIASGLRHHGHAVEGALGFSFGTAEFSQGLRHSSVLSEALRAFYTAEDVTEMVDMWLTLTPTHNAGVLTTNLLGLNASNTHQTIGAQLTARHGNAARGRAETAIKNFKSRAKGVEARLRSAIDDAEGGDVQSRVESLEGGFGHKAGHVRKWEHALKEQYKLFHDYYLWTPGGQAFASVTS